jgi:nucleoside recognition membrane protein YjiH
MFFFFTVFIWSDIFLSLRLSFDPYRQFVKHAVGIFSICGRGSFIQAPVQIQQIPVHARQNKPK